MGGADDNDSGNEAQQEVNETTKEEETYGRSVERLNDYYL